MPAEKGGFPPPDSVRFSIQRDQSPRESTHEDLVAGFRGYIRQVRQEFPFTSGVSDIRIIKDTLMTESNRTNPPERGEFYLPIYHAFHVITYEHEIPAEMDTTTWIISRRYKDEVALTQKLAGITDERQRSSFRKPLSSKPELIKLSPLQVNILDAIVEAAGIMHEKGQATIEIPETLRDYKQS